MLGTREIERTTTNRVVEITDDSNRQHQLKPRLQLLPQLQPRPRVGEDVDINYLPTFKLPYKFKYHQVGPTLQVSFYFVYSTIQYANFSSTPPFYCLIAFLQNLQNGMGIMMCTDYIVNLVYKSKLHKDSTILFLPFNTILYKRQCLNTS